jgi:hypothetical protein
MGDRSGSTGTQFRALFEPALQAYEEKTGVTLAEHPLAVQLHSCHSTESVPTVLLGEAQAFSEFRGSNKLMKSINDIVSNLSRLFSTASVNDAIDMVRQKALMACFVDLTFFYSHSHLRKQYAPALLSRLQYVASF